MLLLFYVPLYRHNALYVHMYHRTWKIIF